MRKINRIVVHCTGGTQNATVDSLKNHWRKIGWRNVGYHFVIAADGKVTQLANLSQVTNGVRGFNSDSVHVAYFGGIDRQGKPIDNRTDAQKKSITGVLRMLRGMLGNIPIVGHRDLSPDRDGDGVVERAEWVKACPCFDAKKEYDML